MRNEAVIFYIIAVNVNGDELSYKTLTNRPFLLPSGNGSCLVLRFGERSGWVAKADGVHPMGNGLFSHWIGPTTTGSAQM